MELFNLPVDGQVIRDISVFLDTKELPLVEMGKQGMSCGRGVKDPQNRLKFLRAAIKSRDVVWSKAGLGSRRLQSVFAAQLVQQNDHLAVVPLSL